MDILLGKTATGVFAQVIPVHRLFIRLQMLSHQKKAEHHAFPLKMEENVLLETFRWLLILVTNLVTLKVISN